MNNNTRKIVVLNDIKSPKIEQAIFILRDDTDSNIADAVSEAEKIVSMYLGEVREPCAILPDKKPKKAPILIAGIMCALFSFFSAYFVVNIIK